MAWKCKDILKGSGVGASWDGSFCDCSGNFLHKQMCVIEGIGEINQLQVYFIAEEIDI